LDILGRPVDAPARGKHVLPERDVDEDDDAEATRQTFYTVVMVTEKHVYVRLNNTEDSSFVPCERWALEKVKKGRRRAETAREKARHAQLTRTQQAAMAFQAAAEAAKPREAIGRDCTKELVLLEWCYVRSVPRTQLFDGPWIGQPEFHTLTYFCNRRCGPTMTSTCALEST
jgi:hypothetical protein